MIRIKTAITLLFLFALLPVSGQRVGLVLSGGGAKGLYHIGVMKALEENGIPIDYVSGTSMGAIIGGLYSIGYSPDEIAAIFRSDQVSYWMSGRIENQYIYYYKRPRPTAAMVNLLLDFKNKKRVTRLPTNLIPSFQIDLAFADFFAQATAASGGDFDRLFVPFRCIATDAAARCEVVYRDGDLGKAIRASMTIPLVFKPLRQDSTLLYDGGIYNNFPWEVLQEDFSPDILIGSKCVEGNAKPNEDDIIDQISVLTMMHTDYELPSENDILIHHVFNDVSMLDFSKVDYVIGRGYSDAIDAMPTILERIGRRVSPEEMEARRVAYRAGFPAFDFDSYEVTGLNRFQTKYVEEMLRLDPDDRNRREQGRSTFTFDEFRSEYFKILSGGDITGEYPDVVFNDSTGKFNLSLALSTKPSFRLMLGGNISSTSMNQAYVGVEYKRIRRNAHTYYVDGYLSALNNSVIAGGRTDFFNRFPFRVDYSFNYNYYNYFRSKMGYISGGNDLTYSKYKDMYLTSAFSFPISRFQVLSLRANLGQDNYRYFQSLGYSDEDEMDRTRFRFVGAKLALERDNRNYLIYPTRGLYQSISAIFMHGREDFYPGSPAFNGNQPPSQERHNWFGGKFVREQYFGISRWFSFGYLVEAVLTDHAAFANDYASNISSPAFTPTPHSQLIYLKDFRSKSFLGLGVMPTFEFGPNFYLKAGAYLFVPDRNEVRENVRKKVRYITNLALVYQTPIGPASLTLSQYDATNRNNWFLTFNFGYTIFNRKGLFY